MAAVLMADGDFEGAARTLSGSLKNGPALGSLEALLASEHVDALYLASAEPRRMEQARHQLARARQDARYRAEVAVANAISAHATRGSHGAEKPVKISRSWVMEVVDSSTRSAW